MTSSNGNIFRVTGHLCEEFPAQRPVARSFDVFFDQWLNKRLRKQSWGWWFETLSRPLWRHCNEIWKQATYSSVNKMAQGNRYLPFPNLERCNQACLFDVNPSDVERTREIEECIFVWRNPKDMYLENNNYRNMKKGDIDFSPFRFISILN